MEPYAYFPYSKESEAVTLFEYIDKKLQGEKIPTFETVVDIQIDNIYLSRGFKRRLSPYFDAINDFISAIQKYPLNYDTTHQLGLFLQEVKSIVSDLNYFKEQQYKDSNNWRKNKLILMGSQQSAFFQLFKSFREFYFYIGLKTGISFDEATNYINTMARLDHPHLHKFYLKTEDLKSIQERINNHTEIQLIIAMIINYSSIEYSEQSKIIENLNNIVPIKEDRKEIKKLYTQVLSQKKQLLSYVNNKYFEFGRQEKKKRTNQLSKKRQHKENIERFHKPTGIAVDVNPSQSICMNCSEHNQIIYDVNLFTPFKHTVATVCINCLLSIANNLKQTEKEHYNYNPISTQLMVNYQHFSKPIIRCQNCGCLSNSMIEFIGVREINSVILCRTCVKNIIKKIDKKHSGHNTLELKTLNGKTRSNNGTKHK